MLALARGLGHKRLVGRHFLDNPASGLVLRRLGFRPTDERGLIFSAGRGRACPSVRLEIELESEQGNQDDSPMEVWKEGVRRNQKLRHSCENV
jgi:RimJ/RimL family protein N-acetyltransferase